MRFNRVLVANRGEVAVRVIRALHELDIEAVAVYSTADSESLQVRLADRAVCVGPPPAPESYLRIPSIIAAANTTGCQAVHPGWGFLAENPAFAEACADNDLVFIGPSPDVMAKMGDKASAREEMGAAGVPLVPGTPPLDADEAATRRRRARLPGAPEGGGRRRGQGHAAGRAPRTSSTARSRRRRPRPRRRSATAGSTSSRRSSRRATSRSR